jgi:hypothetical protein
MSVRVQMQNLKDFVIISTCCTWHPGVFTTQVFSMSWLLCACLVATWIPCTSHSSIFSELIVVCMFGCNMNSMYFLRGMIVARVNHKFVSGWMRIMLMTFKNLLCLLTEPIFMVDTYICLTAQIFNTNHDNLCKVRTLIWLNQLFKRSDMSFEDT